MIMEKNVNRNFSLIYQKKKKSGQGYKNKKKIKMPVHFYVKGRNIKLAHFIRVKVGYVILGGFLLDLLIPSLKKKLLLDLLAVNMVHAPFFAYNHFIYPNLIASKLA